LRSSRDEFFAFGVEGDSLGGLDADAEQAMHWIGNNRPVMGSVR
jgi:hypothetical protein